MSDFSIYYSGIVYSSEDILGRINNTLLFLKKSNIIKGNKIAIISDNSLDYIILKLALIKTNILFIPLNTRYSVIQTKQYINDLNCDYLFTSNKYFKLYSNLISTIPIENINSDFNDIKLLDNLDYFTKPSNYLLNNLTNIILSSGTSTNPKYIVHDYSNHFYSALGSNKNIKLNRKSKWLLSLPLCHVGGLSILFRTLIAESQLVIPDTKFSLTDCIIETYPSHYSFVFTQYQQLIDNKILLNIFKKSRAILLGGSMIPENIIKYSCENKIPIHTSYGSSEMSSQITTTNTFELKDLLSSGLILDFRSIKIDNNNEIFVKGKTLFKGYYKNNKIINSRDENGWFHTRDLGKIDSKGRLYVLGRKDNMFISGGENIYPEKIEKTILKIDGVNKCLVLAVDNIKYGKRPICLLKLNKSLKIKEIVSKIFQEIPKYELPDNFYYWPDEKENNLKINRNKYLKMYENDELKKII
jgi:o-succinylbenzoate---CoA ligase